MLKWTIHNSQLKRSNSVKIMSKNTQNVTRREICTVSLDLK